jgi:alpha-1,3/alpha-1,6-mannosyltransferase
MRKLYSNCYATLFCAIEEDWGIVPVESMASHKPCISINEGGPTYSIVDSKTGFLVNSVDEMANKMALVADHLSMVEEMGRAGRHRVKKNYTWRVFHEKLEKLFKKTARM